ncbi:MAG TPA: hypothetical protein VK190_02810 [Pseudoneobacillus sp.]|nr:hypothetical protein [Pseudoneobacillus sp.]
MSLRQKLLFLTAETFFCWIVLISIFTFIDPAAVLSFWNEQAAPRAILTVRVASALWTVVCIAWMMLYIRKIDKEN